MDSCTAGWREARGRDLTTTDSAAHAMCDSNIFLKVLQNALDLIVGSFYSRPSG
jgi:hypothetical protein